MLPTTLPPPVADVPPANTFWTRYSPHGEAFLSPLASAVLHAGILGAILIGAIGWWRHTSTPVELEIVAIAGGGGDLQGTGTERGPAVGPTDVPEALNPTKPAPPSGPIDEAVVKGPDAPTVPADRPRASGVRPDRRSWGLDGPGTKGGNGTGDGPGVGPGNRKNNSIRGDRAMRWEMLFRTDSHADYLRQLHGLGAYIGIPDQNGRLMVVKNLLERPAQWQYDTISDLGRVFWVDERADSARGIAELLQMSVVPSQFVAFIPKSVEDELVKVEMSFARQYGVTKEHDILATRFHVAFRGGKPHFTVQSQTRK